MADLPAPSPLTGQTGLPAPAALAPPQPFGTLPKPEVLTPPEPMSTLPKPAQLGAAPWDTNTPVSETGASPTWYGRTWQWLNDPLWDVHKTFQAESGWGKGVENVVSSLSAPVSLGLLAASFFGGELGLAGRLAPVLRAAGLGAEETTAALKTAQMLVDGGFTLQQIHGLTQEVPAMMDALKFGDYEKAKELAVESLAGGAFAALGARGVVRDAGLFYDAAKLGKPIAHLMAARREVATHIGNTQINNAESEKIMAGLRGALKDEWKGLSPEEQKIRLAGMRTAAESGFDRNTLMAQHDFLNGVTPVSRMPVQTAEIAGRIAPEWVDNFNKVVYGVNRGQKGIIPVDETKLPTKEEMPFVGKAVYDVLARNYVEEHAARGIDVSKPDIEKVGLGLWSRAMMHLFPGTDLKTFGDLYKKVAIYGPGPQSNMIQMATPFESAAGEEPEIERLRRLGVGSKETPIITPEMAADEIQKLHSRNYGSTFNLYDGDMTGYGAYAVTSHPEETLKLDHAPTKEEIQNFINKKLDLLKDRNLSAGTWFDKDSNTHELSVSSTPRSLEEALRIASEKGEKYIFDLKNNKEIAVTPEGMTEALLQRSELPEAMQNPIKTAPIYSQQAAAKMVAFPGKLEEFQGRFYDKALELLQKAPPEVLQFVNKVLGADVSLFASKEPGGITFNKPWVDSLKSKWGDDAVKRIAVVLADKSWAPASYWENLINDVDKTGKPHIAIDPIHIVQASQAYGLPTHTIESVLMHEAGHVFHGLTAPNDVIKEIPLNRVADALNLKQTSLRKGVGGPKGIETQLNELIAEMFNLYSKEGTRKELTIDERNLIQALARHSGKPELEAFAKAKNVVEFMKNLQVQDPTKTLQTAQLSPREAGAAIIDELREQFGITDNPRQAKFILPNGEMIGGGPSAEHDAMLDAAVKRLQQTDPSIQGLNREQFVNQEKVIRVRPRTGRGGEELAYSLPVGGISDAQREAIRKGAGLMSRTGNVFIEIAHKAGSSKAMEFPRVSDIDGVIDKLYKDFSGQHQFLQMAQPGRPPIDRAGYDKYYSDKEKQNLLDEYKAAMSLSPTEQKVAQAIRGKYDELKELAAKHDVIEHFVNNYITRVWGERPDTSNEAVQNLMHQNRSGLFSTNVAAAMHRMFHTTFEGRMAGFKTLTDDPIALLGHYNTTLKNAISAREMLDNFREQEIKGMDGRPLAAIAGSGKIVGEDSGSPSVLVNPFKKRSIRLAQERIEEMAKSGELQQAISKGFIRQLGERADKDGNKIPLYGWDTTGYKTIDSPIMRHWRYATPDTADNPAPVFLKGDVVVHPDIEKLVKTAIGADKSPITQSKLGRLALRASSEGKHLLLSFSPFHIVQEGLRAIMTGVSPKPWNFNADLTNDTVLQYGVRHGLMLNKDYRGIQDYMEGVGGNSAIINKLPGLRAVHNTMQGFLFDKYIPELKARAYKSLVERYRKYAGREGLGWDEHRIAEEAAAHTNEAFGGLNYRLLGRSLTGQHVLRLSVLAPDWLESQGRFVARALNPESGGLARRDLARISLYTFAAARVINMLVSGQPHIESPFGVVVPGEKGKDDTVYSFRTIPTDLLHAISDPQNFIKGRTNPLTVRTGIEALEGRDEFGRRVTPAQEAGDFLKNIAPIPTQTGLKRMLGQPADLSSTEQVLRGVGASVYKYRTEAEKLAQEMASDRMESGPVSPENQAKHLRDIHLEDMLRSGEINSFQVRQQLPRTEAQGVIDNATLEPLQARVKRLPLHDALSVYQLAMPTEKQQLKQLLWNKRLQWLQRHPGRKDRVDDPTWELLKKTYPDLNNLGY